MNRNEAEADLGFFFNVYFIFCTILLIVTVMFELESNSLYVHMCSNKADSDSSFKTLYCAQGFGKIDNNNCNK